MLDTADAFYTLYYDNVIHCGIEESFISIHDKCYYEKDACSMKRLEHNVTKNWKNIIMAFNGLANLALNYYEDSLEYSSNENVYYVMSEVGKSIANLVVGIFDL